jgi:oxalate decarboxylase
VSKDSCRISAVDQEGRNFLEDVCQGDLWFFPQGIPHHIQALDEGVEFLLVFPDGQFSENNTFLLSDYFAHVPKSVLAKNFGWTVEQMKFLPEGEKYIFQGQVPPRLESDRVYSPTGDVPRSFKHRMLDQQPQYFPGGRVRVTDSRNFTASTTTAAAMVEIEPGGLRELHWHPNNDEWQYYLSGRGRMGVFASTGAGRTFDFQAGDVGYVPFPYSSVRGSPAGRGVQQHRPLRTEPGPQSARPAGHQRRDLPAGRRPCCRYEGRYGSGSGGGPSSHHGRPP